MSQLTLTVLQLGFLVLLWILVLSVLRVLRSDLYGTRVVHRAPAGGAREGRRPARQAVASGAARPAAPRVPPAPTQLVVTEGPLRGTTLSLGQAPILIGRSPECTLVLADDFASGRHARLSSTEQGWVVEDLESTNGTRLDGAPLRGPAVVAVGAQLRIGRTAIELRR
jgi:pSer/pThr/pTyr-binding forkhead associated (FHA) protein